MVHHDDHIHARHQRLNLAGESADEGSAGILVPNNSLMGEASISIPALMMTSEIKAPRIHTAALKPAKSTLATMPIQLVRMIS